MFQNIDFRLNVTPDSTSLSNLKAINAELEKMVNLLGRTGGGTGAGVGAGVGGGMGFGSGGGTAGANAAAAAGVGGGGGMGGGGGGGGGGLRGGGAGAGTFGSAGANASAAAGFPASAGGFSSSGGGGLGIMAGSIMSQATEGNETARAMTAEERHRQNLRRWQLTMGIQSLGYGLEDIYYSGIRGALNNFPFAAQGLAALAGVNPATSMAVAGGAALFGTAGMVAYDNRERIAKGMGFNLGSREDNIFGLPDLSGAQKAQKDISDAMYYVDKYGRGSDLGQRYLADAIGAMQRSNRDLASRPNEQEIARIRDMPDAGLMTGAQIMGTSGIGGDAMARRMAQQGVSVSEADIRKQADMLYQEGRFAPFERIFGANTPSINILGMNLAGTQMPESYLQENRAAATKKAEEVARAARDQKSTNLAQALAGDPNRIAELERGLKDGSLTGRDAEAARAAVGLARNMSSFDAQRIASLRSGAANPYANIDRIGQQMAGYMGDAAGDLMPGEMDEMREAQRRGSRQWQRNFEQNEGRYISNIAASYGGIKASGTRGNARSQQLANLRSEIYNDLVRSGVPAGRARQLARELDRSGRDTFNEAWADSDLPNGMNQMQNFMMGLGEEQQMMFGQFNQNAMQIQMHQQMLRQQRMRRTRFGLRGMN
jgi:hypothetical protein